MWVHIYYTLKVLNLHFKGPFDWWQILIAYNSLNTEDDFFRFYIFVFLSPKLPVFALCHRHRPAKTLDTVTLELLVSNWMHLFSIYTFEKLLNWLRYRFLVFLVFIHPSNRTPVPCFKIKFSKSIQHLRTHLHRQNHSTGPYDVQ